MNFTYSILHMGRPDLAHLFHAPRPDQSCGSFPIFYGMGWIWPSKPVPKPVPNYQIRLVYNRVAATCGAATLCHDIKQHFSSAFTIPPPPPTSSLTTPSRLFIVFNILCQKKTEGGREFSFIFDFKTSISTLNAFLSEST
jgi:hypothetical protein